MKNQKSEIKNLQQDVGDHGWSWQIQRGNWTGFYRTNAAGEGLFMRTAAYDYRQIDGTCQFGLVPDRAATRRIIRRRFSQMDVMSTI